MNNTQDKFRVNVGTPFKEHWAEYFFNFYTSCQEVAIANNWNIDTVCNYALKPHGRLIKTSTQGWYLRWDDEKYHTLFLLRWS